MVDYSTTIEPRYRDLDGMNHVNHAVFITYLEKARNEFFEKVLEMDLKEPDVVVVSLHLDYEAPINWGDDVIVTLTIDGVGDRSFSLAYEIQTESRVSATAETTQVTIDPEEGSSRPIPKAYKAAFGTSE